MATRLRTRVRRLEGAGEGEPCGDCGAPGDPSRAGYAVEWSGRPNEGPNEPEWCGTCGRQTVVVVTWDDIPDADTMRRRQGRGWG